MSVKTVRISIPRKGLSLGKTHPKITSTGFSGPACKEATKQFEQALGSVIADENTAEMYDVEEHHEHIARGPESADG